MSGNNGVERSRSAAAPRDLVALASSKNPKLVVNGIPVACSMKIRSHVSWPVEVSGAEGSV